MHLAVDAHGLPVRMIVTKGTAADCSQAATLIDGLLAEHVLADKAHDTNALLKYLMDKGMNQVIPPSRRRKTLRAYDRDIYRHRHLVENAFLKLKQWRAVATRYAKTTASFLAECQIAAIMLWMRQFGDTL